MYLVPRSPHRKRHRFSFDTRLESNDFADARFRIIGLLKYFRYPHLLLLFLVFILSQLFLFSIISKRAGYPDSWILNLPENGGYNYSWRMHITSLESERGKRHDNMKLGQCVVSWLSKKVGRPVLVTRSCPIYIYCHRTSSPLTRLLLVMCTSLLS